MNNILITSAGRRVSLVNYFKIELNKISPSSKVYTAELNPQWSSACRISDGFFNLPRVDSENYIHALLNICIENKIKIVIPTLDTELKVLALSKPIFDLNNINVIISDHSLILQCRDKRKSNLLFEQLGIRFPSLIDKDNLRFPLFIKPYDGSLSKDIYLIQNNDELTSNLLNNPKLMFMEYFDPKEYQEYTVDAYFDKSHILKCLVPRCRIEVRGGEISKGRTEKKDFYKILKEKLYNIPGALGCLTIQFFIGKNNNEIIGIEVNPRFGGGFPLSYAAGANFPAYILREYLLNESIAFNENWTENLVMLRFDSEVILNQSDFLN